MNKAVKKIAEVMASAAMKSAKGSYREVSKEGIYQPMRPQRLDQLAKQRK